MSRALLVFLFVPVLHAQTPSTNEIHQAATRAVAMVQHGTTEFSKIAPCFSCHNHALPIQMFNVAREHGVSVDEAAANQVVNKGILASPDFNSIDRAVQDPMIIDPAVSEGWALLTAHEAGVQPNLVLATYARRIANWQQPDGHWLTFDARPPQSSSVFASTAVALRAIHLYLPESMSTELRLRTDRALQWLFANKPQSTEDASFRLMGLHWGGKDASECKPEAEDLLTLQRPDGGWSQLPHMESDAYSTGEALIALIESGSVAITDSAWQKGLRYLLSSQQPDGTWHIATRQISPASVSPPYFESGFPYGHDQYISTSGTAWAAMALMVALPKSTQAFEPDGAKAPPPPGLEPWMETALFGSVKALKSLLDKGLDPNSKTPAGTTLLMMCAQDPKKIELVILQGAMVRTGAKSGYTALIIAAGYRGNSRGVKYLLDHGAEANPTKEVMVNASPLVYASMAGEVGNVSALLDHGADLNHRMDLLGMAPVTPLYVAVEFGHGEVVRTLIKSKADIRAKDQDGMTMLHVAVLAHRPETVKLLLDAGAEVNTVDRFGFTPLQYATTVDAGDAGVVTMLLQAGADPNIKDQKGKTAFERGQNFPYVASALAGMKH